MDKYEIGKIARDRKDINNMEILFPRGTKVRIMAGIHKGVTAVVHNAEYDKELGLIYIVTFKDKDRELKIGIYEENLKKYTLF